MQQVLLLFLLLAGLRSCSSQTNSQDGKIPVSTNSDPGLDKLVKANHFHFSENQLTGTMNESLFNAKMNLIHVIFDNNNFTGAIPESLGLVQTLQIIRLDHNQFNGPVPKSIGNLPNLTELSLASNQLSGTVPDLTNATNLTYVDTSNNDFASSPAPRWLSTLTSLNTIFMENDHLNGTIPSALFSLPQMQQISLAKNALTGTLDMSGIISSQLRVVNLTNNQIAATRVNPSYTNSLMQPIEKGKYIVREIRTAVDQYDQEYYGLKSLIDPAIRDSAKLVGFRRFLQLAMECVEESGVDRPTMNDVVKELEIIMQNEGGQLLDSAYLSTEHFGNEISRDPQEEHLPMKDDSSSSSVFDYNSVYSYSAVEPKDLSFNAGLGGPLPAAIGNLRQLTTLHFNKNRLTGNLTGLFNSSMILEHILFDNNQLSGRIPAELSDITTLEIIRLDKNNFTGEVPSNISNLINLNVLNLANNQLSGIMLDLSSLNTLNVV
ncbi:hypothetical protein ACQ4PT_068358 [Festuca glaucescens]